MIDTRDARWLLLTSLVACTSSPDNVDPTAGAPGDRDGVNPDAPPAVDDGGDPGSADAGVPPAATVDRLAIVAPPALAGVQGRLTLHGRCSPGADVLVDGAGLAQATQVPCSFGIFDLDLEVSAGPGPKLVSVSQPTLGPAERVQRTFTRAAVPAAVDNSQQPWFPKIRAQGSTNTCVGFATTYYQLTYEVARQLGTDARTDEARQFSPRWTYNLSVSGSDTGMTDGQAYTLLRRHGAATWAAFPYSSDVRSWPIEGATWVGALEARVDELEHELELADPAGLARAKERLANGQVLVASTYIDGWKYRAISDDPATIEDDAEVGKQACTHATSSGAAYHVLAIVGYDDRLWIDVNGNGILDPGERGALRIANSYGTTWKDKGFTWLSYDALRAVSSVAGAPSAGRRQAFIGALGGTATAVTVSTTKPSLVAEVTLSHARRDELRFEVGRREPGGEEEAKQAYPLGGGAMGFTGGGAASATLAFDLSSLAVSGLSRGWFLRVTDVATGSPAHVTDARVVAWDGAAWSSTVLPASFDHASQTFEVEATVAPTPSGVRLQGTNASGPVGGRAELVLERTGDVTAPLSVMVEPLGRSAQAGVDFLAPASPWRVRWGANDSAPVRLSIPLLGGAGKQFVVRLSRVQSTSTAMVAAPHLATVTIQ